MIGVVLAALVPVVLLITLGVVLKRHIVHGPEFWAGAERLSYQVLLPALFVHGLSTADMSGLPVGPLAGVLVASTLAVTALVLLVRPLLRIDGATFTSVFQGSVRFNNYIGVTIAGGMFGSEGIAVAAVCNGVIVPLVNVLCVLVFARFGDAEAGLSATLRQLVTNPLILACGIGIALQVSDLALPPGIGPAVQALGTASMPLGLLCVGAALRFGVTRAWRVPLVASSTMKFAAMPVATSALAGVFGLGGQALIVALMFQALPTATSSYILARRLGGDAPLMAGTIAIQTVLGLVAVPAVLLVALG